jgi:Fe-S cluster assembly scaffold protein SufB
MSAMTASTDLLTALAAAGGDVAVLGDPATAHVAASGHALLSHRTVPGIEIAAHAGRDAIEASVTVRAGLRAANPIHLCFGVVEPEGTQRIRMRVRLEAGAAAAFVAHCLFPNARRVQHLMDAVIDVEEHAEMRYAEGHYHGPFGGIEVVPKALFRLAPHARLVSDFSLTTGRVGALAIDYRVEAGAGAVVELTARIFAHGSDEVRIRDHVVLDGRDGRALVKTRVALQDDASAEVTGIAEGNAEGARAHMDCMEIVRDRARASAIPIVKVTHPLAKVTHEAAIGSVDKKQLETLMARGLTPEEAVDVIVRGVLR